MNDGNTSIAKLKSIVDQFSNERDWQQFYDAKSLCMNLSVEANELMEIFIWSKQSEIESIVKNKRKDIEFEAADILFSLLLFCNKYDIDITQAMVQKIAHNAKKYPVNKARGNNKKYTDL